MDLFFIGGGNCTHIIIDELKNFINKAYVFDINKKNYNDLLHNYSFVEPATIKDLETLSLKNIKIDFVIECASIDAVLSYYKIVLKNNLDFIILSTGAFANAKFFNNFFNLLQNSHSKVYIPSGAIGGLDIINSIKEKIISLSITTKKPPLNLDIKNPIKTPETIFDGDVFNAIEKFPRNINVAVTLALSIKDFKKVKVKIIADPFVKRNIHVIEIRSTAGKYLFEIENYPSPNGRTSYLAPLSIAGLLRKLQSNFRIGI